MTSIAWKDQYKHPEWQKKRLECMEAAEWTCQCCFEQEVQLHVHHRAYIKNRLIWEYEVAELEVLCEACHSGAHAAKDILNGVIARIPVDALFEVIGLISGYAKVASGPISASVIDEKAISDFTTKHNIGIGMLAGQAQYLSDEALHKLEAVINDLLCTERKHAK